MFREMIATPPVAISDSSPVEHDPSGTETDEAALADGAFIIAQDITTAPAPSLAMGRADGPATPIPLRSTGAQAKDPGGKKSQSLRPNPC